jgi:hypothetical protein
MTKRFLVVASCLLALAASAAVAHAATKHKVSDTMKLRVLSGNASVIVYTGTIKDKFQGDGVVVVRVTPSKTPGTFNSAGTAFFKKGTVTVKGSNTATANADGSTTYAGSVKATRGTGALKGVTGTVKLTGLSTSADPTYAEYKLTGSLTY